MHARSAVLFVFGILAACSSSAPDTSSAPPSRGGATTAPGASAPPAEKDTTPAPLPGDPQAPPRGVGDDGTTGNMTALGSVGDASCTFDLAYGSAGAAAGGAPLYTIVLTKRDTHNGSCSEHKGETVLADGSYELPVAFIAKHPADSLLVVAYDGRYSATSAIYTRLVQIDWTTGQRLHEGEMAVRGTSPFPIPAVLRPRGVAVDGRDVLLQVVGPFPGAGDGESFEAFYADFLGTEPQESSPAAYATPL